jgi:hypothetical protein
LLSGFECDEDQTGWLAGLVVWSIGAAAGCFFALATIETALPHSQVLALAVLVSLVTLGLRSPVMLSRCCDQIWLTHAVWMFALFAQINWAGFLAARASSSTIAAEAILICLGLEAWLLVRCVARGDLPWLQQFFLGTVQHAIGTPIQTSLHSEGPERSLALAPTVNEDEGVDDVRREVVDGFDENGQRYLSGTARLHFQQQQRTETLLLGFCPALNGVAQVDLECDSEDVTAKVENATEVGARISVRRTHIAEAAVVTVDWYATASEAAANSLNLP